MGRHRQISSSKKNVRSGFIRMISGQWRGRKLPVHDAEGLRPTTDRVKETLFNWLATDLPQSRCLDLFAGAGSLGFEAASRYAASVTMIELNRTVFQQLQTNCQTLSAENIDILHQDALTYLGQIPPSPPFDIVFIDPPFRHGLLEEVLQKLQQPGWLTTDSLIYVESEQEWQPTGIPEHWQLHREKKAGQVCYRLFQTKDTSSLNE